MKPRRFSLDEGVQDITTIMLPKITDMMELEFLQQFQDTFSESFDISVMIFDRDGKPVTRPATSTRASTLAEDDTARTEVVLKAVKSGQIEKGRDTRGFLHLALPIKVQELTVGVMLVADIPDEKTDLKHLRELARHLDSTPEEVRKQSGRRSLRAVAVLQFAVNALAGMCHERWIISRHL